MKNWSHVETTVLDIRIKNSRGSDSKDHASLSVGADNTRVVRESTVTNVA